MQFNYIETSMKSFSIDINCDLGEGVGNEADIMPFISSANISCGFHAGSEDTIKRTIEIAQQYDVAIGAHPGYDDRENFGRISQFVTILEFAELIAEQYYAFEKVAFPMGAKIHHVKLHGALYNDCAKDQTLSKILIQTVQAIDPLLTIYGLSGSCTIQQAILLGQPFSREAFADRTYQNNGQLTPRHLEHAMIEDVNAASAQVLRLVKENKVTTIQGEDIDLLVDTICIHGDGTHAIEFAERFYNDLKKNNIEIKNK
jgi:UPF0271 protein